MSLESAGITDPIRAVGKLMKLTGDSLLRHGAGLSYILVREMGEVVGDHVHILFHLRRDLSKWFARRKPGWLRSCGAKRGRSTSLTPIIHGSGATTGNPVMSPEVFSINFSNVTAYVLKHCSTDVQRHFGIHSNGPCTLVGKRVSISENLHRTARSRYTAMLDKLPNPALRGICNSTKPAPQFRQMGPVLPA